MKIGPTKSGLNYRESRPINGVLGKKLGTWGADTHLQILDVFDDDWAAVYYNGLLVFAHSDFIEIQELDILAIHEKISHLRLELEEVEEALSAYITKPNPIQPDYTKRVPSIDGKWLTPVYSNVLSSNEHDHHKRGSVDAWDISKKVGSAIYPVADGIVVYNADEQHKSHGYGIWTVIEHGNYYVYYCHLKNLPPLSKGDVVKQDSQFGEVGMTGLTSWPHIHIEVHLSGYKGRLEPSSFWDVNSFFYSKFLEE